MESSKPTPVISDEQATFIQCLENWGAVWTSNHYGDSQFNLMMADLADLGLVNFVAEWRPDDWMRPKPTVSNLGIAALEQWDFMQHAKALDAYVNKMPLQDRIESVQDMWETYIVAKTKMPQSSTSARLADAILGACYELQGEVMHPTAWLRSHGVDVDGGAE